MPTVESFCIDPRGVTVLMQVQNSTVGATCNVEPYTHDIVHVAVIRQPHEGNVQSPD